MNRRTKLTLAGLGIFVAAAAAEVVARALAPPPPVWLERPQRLLRFDPVRGWSLVPGARDFTVDQPVSVNAAGFRGREVEPKPAPGVARIACLGDSDVFGYGVALERSFPRQLERRLESQSPVEVLNCGVAGWNARQVRLTLEREVVRFRPELVLYALYWDDLVPIDLEHLTRESLDARLAADEPRGGEIRALLRRSRALYLAVQAVESLRESRGEPRNGTERVRRALLGTDEQALGREWETLAREVGAMRDAARSSGSRFGVVVWPMPELARRVPESRRFGARARALCARAGVPCLSVDQAFESVLAEGKDPYLLYGIHPTAEVYARSAELVAAWVRREGLVAPSGEPAASLGLSLDLAGDRAR